MTLDEYLHFVAGKMREAADKGDKVELTRLIDLTITTLNESKQKIK